LASDASTRLTRNQDKIVGLTGETGSEKLLDPVRNT
jgi:hypothetical protein